MQFYANPTQIKGAQDMVMCANPLQISAGTSCCADGTSTNGVGAPLCEYYRERVTYATAVERCEAAGKFVCARSKHTASDDLCQYGNEGTKTNAPYHTWTWQTRSCDLQIQIEADGSIAMVHPHPSLLGTHQDGASDNDNPETMLDSGNLFRVPWLNDTWPKVGTPDCESSACSTHAGTCLCATRVETVAAYTDEYPSRAQVLSTLRIGSPEPDTFDDGLYTRCVSADCLAKPGLEIWTRGDGQLDSSTIFKVSTDHGVVLHLTNKVSSVYIPDSQFGFRNAPTLMDMQDQTRRDALYETEALIDHLFHHPNVAPFVSHRLIQRFTTSNPSPRYVEAVATAFSTGQYGGRTYGGYGDLGATLVAILLDPEARSAVLQHDPTHGLLREPLIKVLHVMRALEFESRDQREITLMSMEDKVGMMAHRSPSVFNFYLPEFQPAGPIADAGLVSPEAELATTPLVKSFLNGMLSLVRWGLTNCHRGFGTSQMFRSCHTCNGNVQATNDGLLAYQPASAGSSMEMCYETRCGENTACNVTNAPGCARPDQSVAHASCCADTAVPNFKQLHPETCADVWSERDVNGVGCSGLLTYSQAVSHCTDMGGRLCNCSAQYFS
jgi:hypothetical protein